LCYAACCARWFPPRAAPAAGSGPAERRASWTSFQRYPGASRAAAGAGGQLPMGGSSTEMGGLLGAGLPIPRAFLGNTLAVIPVMLWGDRYRLLRGPATTDIKDAQLRGRFDLDALRGLNATRPGKPTGSTSGRGRFRPAQIEPRSMLLPQEVAPQDSNSARIFVLRRLPLRRQSRLGLLTKTITMSTGRVSRFNEKTIV